MRFLQRLVRNEKERCVEMKVDVTQLPYNAVMEAVNKAGWLVNELACDNGRVVLVCQRG